MSFTSSQTINALTAPDTYTVASTIENLPIQRIILDITNQAIIVNLKVATSGMYGNWDSTELFLIPQFKQMNRRVVGVRFRAAIVAARIPPGALQAVVTVEAVRG
jgi:hypothetical protein